MRASDSPQERAAALLAAMNVTDKIRLLHQDNMQNYSGVVLGDPRLGIPALSMNNGRQGFATAQGAGGGASNSPWSTAFPCQLAISATFDAELVREFGAALAQEFFLKGANVVLAPMLILARVPQGGRNFESVGEDPEWAYEFARAHVAGAQSVPGVLANADDFVLNNQETNRYGGNSVADERTRWELYYRAYQGAVDAEVASFMCSYNKVGGTYACENSVTLGDLKGRMNFSGWVLSDWEGTHSTVAAANAGLDQEMGWSIYFFAGALEKAVEDGQVSQTRFDDMVLRILTQMFKFGLFDVPADPARNQNANATSPEHNALARRLAAAGTVLLQNLGGLLPLSDAAPPRSILVLGDSGDRAPQCCPDDQGSGDVTPPYVVSPLQGIRARASAATAVSYLPSAVGVQPLTQYWAASRKLHYLAWNCLGCPKGNVYAPERVEGYALQDNCAAGASASSCVVLTVFYNPATGANLVAPSAFAPPAGFAPWAGGVAGFALALNYSGAAPTAVLELWTDGTDFVSLSTEASRAEVRAANYSLVASLARLLTNQSDPRNPNPTLEAALAADVVVLCVGESPSARTRTRANT
jgi:beta-glucosidase-like glycosyl hydrolase